MKLPTIDDWAKAFKSMKFTGYNPDWLMINPKVEEFIFNNIFIKLKYGYEYEVTRSEYNILKRLRKDFSKIDKEDFEKILLAIRI